MAKRGAGSGLGWLVAVVIVIAVIPREIWLMLGVLAAMAGGVYAYLRWKAAKDQASAEAAARNEAIALGDQPTLAELTGKTQPGRTAREKRGAAPQATPPQAREGGGRPPPRQSASTPNREFYSAVVADAQRVPKQSYSVPKPPPGFGGARWVSPNEIVEIAGTQLPGGLFYIGTKLQGANGRTDPCLISGQYNVARHGDFRERQTDYWPSYAEISSSARRAYLNWLSQGRSHPDCNIGYVFLFFYGLERRVLVDTPNDPAAKQDWPAIAAEVRRLLAIYGEKSGSFRRYAGELLDWMEIDSASDKLYLLPLPSFPQAYEIPLYVRLALGQSAVDRAPIPASLALAWVRLQPGSYLRTAATRCPEEFEKLFSQRYHEILGNGLVLPKNRTKLKFVYRPASAGFHGIGQVVRSFGDVPDATALTAPIKTLQEIANQCTDELGAFSRAVGKDASVRNTLDGLLQLPASLWPEEASSKLQSVLGQMKDGMLTTPLGELIASLGGSSQAFNRDKVRGLARTLEAVKVGMEPNVLAGAKAPTEKDPVVLFSMPAAEERMTDTGAYHAATLTLQLASAVAQADGEFNASEIAHLRSEITNWKHLTPAHQQRLHAHLQWLVAAPVSLASLKKKLEPLELKAKEAVAAFMATLAQADGAVSPDEMKFLEKVYKALGVEPKRVFTDVHAVSAGSSAKRSEQTGFRLDATRIAELQQDTERVSALLANIFREEEAPAAVIVSEELPEAVAIPGLLGLDEMHTALLRLMASRTEWTRAELEDAAADLELMRDGALEPINDASFDAYDLPFAEGDDPVEINAEVVEKIES